jgi:hypothetical protein
MKIAEDDYVVANIPTKAGKDRHYLVKVKSALDQGEFLGRLEQLCHLKPQNLTLKKTSIRVNLGPNPVKGSYLGVSTKKLFLKTANHPTWGGVHFFCKPSKDDRNSLGEAMTHVHKLLKKQNLGFLLEEGTSIEVTAKAHSKYAGCFMYSKDRDKIPSRLEVCIDAEELKKIGSSDLSYVLAHELGHALHYHHLKQFPSLEAKWVELYRKTRGIVPVSAAKCKEYLKALLAEGNIKSAAGSLAEEDTQGFKLTVKYVSVLRKVTPGAINLLLQEGDHDSVTDLWPKCELSLSDLKPLVTEYALKNYYELFAETFALHLIGKELPKSAAKLLNTTLTTITKGTTE